MSTSPIKSRGRALRAFVRRHRRLLVFAAKMAAAYAAWFALYDLWLAPDGRLDAWLAEGTASLSTWLLSLGGFETFAAGRTFGLAGAPGLRVTDGCNGLSVLGLSRASCWPIPAASCGGCCSFRWGCSSSTG